MSRVCTDLSTAVFRTWNSVDSSVPSQTNISQVLPTILTCTREMMTTCTSKINCKSSAFKCYHITELFVPTSDNTQFANWFTPKFHKMPYSCCLISPLYGSGALAVFEPEAHSAFCRVVPDQAFMFPEVLSNPSSAKQYVSIFLAGQMKHLWVLV